VTQSCLYISISAFSFLSVPKDIQEEARGELLTRGGESWIETFTADPPGETGYFHSALWIFCLNKDGTEKERSRGGEGNKKIK
jgi:hypothetical protein